MHCHYRNSSLVARSLFTSERRAASGPVRVHGLYRAGGSYLSVENQNAVGFDVVLTVLRISIEGPWLIVRARVEKVSDTELNNRRVDLRY